MKQFMKEVMFEMARATGTVIAVLLTLLICSGIYCGLQFAIEFIKNLF